MREYIRARGRGRVVALWKVVKLIKDTGIRLSRGIVLISSIFEGDSSLPVNSVARGSASSVTSRETGAFVGMKNNN